MVLITEDLIRKRAEHNEGEIHSLEELTLHQQNLERIDNLEQWCKHLRILYLQNNLLSKIENVSKLKKLEYLNLALNNIEKIENLEGCESLKKLDLTVNFIGELTSIQSLVNVQFLEELYLTGNPCTEYPGYREYVIASLPQLKSLDGNEITKSERIIALQNFDHILPIVLEKQKEYEIKRKSEKIEAEQRRQKRSEKYKNSNGLTDKDTEEFWNEKIPYTPESRIEAHEYMQLQAQAKESKDVSREKKTEATKLFTDDGRPLNVNKAKIGFQLTEDTINDQDVYILNVAVYKYMDTALIDCDIQTNYVRVILNKKILQLALPEEVSPDNSSIKRSQTTGHLLITMPKAFQEIRVRKNKETKAQTNTEKKCTGVSSYREKPCKENINDQSNVKSTVPSKYSSALLDVENQSTNNQVNQRVSGNTSSGLIKSCGYQEKRKSKIENQIDDCMLDCSDVPPLI
uniref:U2A'/phosphoprotein 32 family A C-terminal domain-containing protein n=1 Tax=Trichobilharzia regenti TaxID=157069 RepID=A0AA85J9X3_TRIRE|nr:unnamed protein product [Trichobilharzia regenti]